METLQKIRLHPLMAGAAVAAIIASAGVAAAPPYPSEATPLYPPGAQAYPPAAPAYPPTAQAAPSCPNCGVVASVSAYRQKPRHSVVGMVGGGVVGALVGNEIGNGSTLATVGGAAGGAYLGNKVGQKVQSTTRYKVVVRMDGGGTRTVTYASRPAFVAGSHVRVENGKLVQAG